MKRFLIAAGVVFMTTLICSVTKVSAQSVTYSGFSTKVSLLNSELVAGDTAAARITFDTVNEMMKTVLGVTKYSIKTAMEAGNDSLKSYYTNYLRTQQVPLYYNIWHLKSNMVANRDSMVYKLNSFGSLIY